MAYPRFQRARDFKFANHTSGHIILNSVSWANVDTLLDMVLVAQSGDVIEYGISSGFSNENTNACLDVATVVSGSVVNTFSKQGPESPTSEGIQAWRGINSQYDIIGGSVMYQLQAGDISSGTVTLRLRYKTLAATNKTIYGADDSRLCVWAKNLGPRDPN